MTPTDDAVIRIADRRVMVFAADGPAVTAEADALDLIGATWGQEVDWLVLPTERLSPEFLDLKTGLAGALLQKIVTYGQRLAIVGDITAAEAASGALRDFVRESNRGDRIWFAPDMTALEARLRTR
ncbi:MAG: DUF4180 domain-containing protein [Brevundimonas sp.]|uniref:DUF4180 domain-containing protein n=1 Tax=Brevundimonas sp. TaxID=1871086 RepID=UPI001200DAFC|nr:DUF4180 domain-containing protein [Brevundimonas sp.]RZJ17504.1 MAG: DUF4180 domain-containing protein [Brevundimonas sp.]